MCGKQAHALRTERPIQACHQGWEGAVIITSFRVGTLSGRSR